MALNKSCILPVLTEGSSFELFQANVEAVKKTSKRWREVLPEDKDDFEANQLILATSAHPLASAVILAVWRRYTRKEFVDAAGLQDPSKWCAASWEALRQVCEPLDRDAKEKIRKELDNLPTEAEEQFGEDITGLLTRFNGLRSDAVKWDVTYTAAGLADILIRAAPEHVRLPLRLHLQGAQEEPDKVVEALRSLARASGNALGLERQRSTVKQELFFTGTADRPYTNGRPSKSLRGNRRGGGQASGGQRNAGAGGTGQHGGCGKCGRPRPHDPGYACPAAEQLCRGCNKKGHFERVCRSRKQPGEAPAEGARHATVQFCDLVDAPTQYLSLG
eukprot:GHVU01200712.1.p1 GENE.GHVU01200712.1~~GHVU01200712.1.p1  ORF type:complete len:333 (+),score=28.63 GHVU01200712.1:411-1409(+)